MDNSTRRRSVILAIFAIVIIVIILLLLTKCPKEETENPIEPPETPAEQTATDAVGGTASPDDVEKEEVLTAATVTAPPRVPAGAIFSVTWTGPNNEDDFVTIVQPDAPETAYQNYAETREGATVELTAPIEPGAYEVRYVTARSHTVLGRAPIEVEAAEAMVDAPAEVILGSAFSVAWTGPDNVGDYITIVPAGAADAEFRSYVNTERGSPVTLTAPTIKGDAEVRYVSGQGRKVLARRGIQIIMAEVSLAAPDQSIAGSTIEVTWTGPNNAGDYITVVPAGTPDGQYGNYTNTSNGSPLEVLMPIMEGGAEIRYMTSDSRRVLARRAISIIAAEVTLSAPEEAAAGADVSITWTGPDHPGDYITIVVQGTPDGQYGTYTVTAQGSPLSVKMPDQPGDAEIRYMTGQGGKVLARRPIRVLQ